MGQVLGVAAMAVTSLPLYIFVHPFLYFSHLLIMVLTPSLGEDSWKGTSTTNPEGDSTNLLEGVLELTLTQAHNCTNGDDTYLYSTQIL